MLTCCAHLPSQGGLTWAEFPASPSPLLPTSALALWLLSMPPARPYHPESLFTNQRHLLGPIPLWSGIQKMIRFGEALPNSVCSAATPRQPRAHTRSHIPTRWQVAVDPHLERSTETHRSLQPLGPQRKWLWRKHVTLLMKLSLGHPTLCFTLNMSSHLWNSTSSVPVNSFPKD